MNKLTLVLAIAITALGLNAIKVASVHPVAKNLKDAPHPPLKPFNSIEMRSKRQKMLFDLIDSNNLNPKTVKEIYDKYPDSICDCK